MAEPLVTVLCITFNQGEYVEDMLKGLLMQETDFPVEYIIHDDASTDKTRRILEKYDEENPGFFHMIYEKENQWSKGVKITQSILVPLIRGKYVAFCEGDDYWIDSHKLQEQVDFLESHPEYSCVAHNALQWNVSSNMIYPFQTCEKSREVEPKEIIFRRFPYLATASKIYRKDAFVLDGFFLEGGEIGDVCAEYYALTKGKFYYIDKIMSIYRFNAKGSYSVRISGDPWHNLRTRSTFFEFLRKYNEYTDNEYKLYISLYMSSIVNYIFTQFDSIKPSHKEFDMKSRALLSGDKQLWARKILKIMNIMMYGYDEEFIDEMRAISRDYSIYIYGAGNYGLKIANCLLNGDVPFSGFVVTDTDSNEKRVLGLPVNSIYEKEKRASNPLFLIAMDVKNWEDVYKTLKTQNIDKYICPLYLEP